MDTFLQFWQHLPSKMDPVLVQIGFFKVQYYGLMYMVAFACTYLLAMHRIKKEKRFPYDSDFVFNILVYAIMGVIIGGRLGYVIFYNLPYYLSHPLEIILPVSLEGGVQYTGFSGMSYHGGLIGVLVACYLFVRKHKLNYWNLADLFAPVIPLGYTFGRIGNFINGELWGRKTDAAIGMFFPLTGDKILRHPSQLYEGFSEGILLFLILWSIRKFKYPEGSMMPAYIFGYGFFRYIIEYFREPDAHLGFIFLNQSMGQLLCIGMMLFAVAFYYFLKSRNPIWKEATGPVIKGKELEAKSKKGRRK